MANSAQQRLPLEAPKVGSVWKHWKGATYKVVLVTIDEGSGLPLVHYESEFGRSQGWVPWTRPLVIGNNAFLGDVPEIDLEQYGASFTPGIAVRRFVKVQNA